MKYLFTPTAEWYNTERDIVHPPVDSKFVEGDIDKGGVIGLINQGFKA